jgi:hypothetical protein
MGCKPNIAPSVAARLHGAAVTLDLGKIKFLHKVPSFVVGYDKNCFGSMAGRGGNPKQQKLLKSDK